MTGVVPGGRPRVLVVEDEEPLRELMVVTLGDEFACEEAADGDAALELLHREPPALVLLDAMIPGRSGLDVLRDIRGDERLRDLPVVIVSAWQQPQDVEAAMAAGANEFIGKPFKVEELSSIVRSLVARG